MNETGVISRTVYYFGVIYKRLNLVVVLFCTIRLIDLWLEEDQIPSGESDSKGRFRSPRTSRTSVTVEERL